MYRSPAPQDFRRGSGRRSHAKFYPMPYNRRYAPSARIHAPLFTRQQNLLRLTWRDSATLNSEHLDRYRASIRVYLVSSTANLRGGLSGEEEVVGFTAKGIHPSSSSTDQVLVTAVHGPQSYEDDIPLKSFAKCQQHCSKWTHIGFCLPTNVF